MKTNFITLAFCCLLSIGYGAISKDYEAADRFWYSCLGFYGVSLVVRGLLKLTEVLEVDSED